jgi:hypothetical protein
MLALKVLRHSQSNVLEAQGHSEIKRLDFAISDETQTIISRHQKGAREGSHRGACFALIFDAGFVLMVWSEADLTLEDGTETYLHSSEKADTPASAPHSTPPCFSRQALTSADIHCVVEREPDASSNVQGNSLIRSWLLSAM